MSAEPSKLTPLIALAVCNAVAVAAFPEQLPDEPLAFPVRLAVIVPAEKLPLPSRATTVLAVLASVASTPIVTPVLPLKLVPVRCVPNVSVPVHVLVSDSRESLPIQTVEDVVPVGIQPIARVPPAPAFGMAFAAAVAVDISSLPPF